MMRTMTAALAALFVGTGAASATTVSFGGAWDADIGNSVSCSVFLAGCTDFTVTANYGGVLNSTGVAVSQRPDGLGVNGKPDLQPFQIDGFPEGSFEYLTFNFVAPVTLTGVTLGDVNGFLDHDDEYSVYIDGAKVGPMQSASSWSGTVPIGSSFSIAAIGGDALNDCDSCGFFGLPKYDDFVVSSISYEATPVPLPAAGFLLLGSLGGLAAIRRKRRS